MEINKSTLYGLIILIVIITGGYFLMNESGTATSGNVVAPTGDIQEITIGIKDYNYYPNTIEVESGKTVRINLDQSVVGCFRDFTIREFGIHEYLKTPEDYVEFTPTKSGTYTFACSMGMGTGKLVVK